MRVPHARKASVGIVCCKQTTVPSWSAKSVVPFGANRGHDTYFLLFFPACPDSHFVKQLEHLLDRPIARRAPGRKPTSGTQSNRQLNLL